MEVKTIKTHWLDGQLKQNTHIIEGENTCIVIDAGCPISEIQALTQKPISLVLLTHGHIDHISYIEEYAKNNIPICGSKKTKAMLENKIENLTEYFNMPKIFKVKGFLNIGDLDEVKLREFDITAYTTPGHTSDSMTYLVTDGKQKLLFTGDTLFSVAVGSTNFNTSSIKDLIKSLRKIDKLEYDEMYSGHGSSSTKERQTKNIARWIDILKQELKLDRKNFIVYE